MTGAPPSSAVLPPPRDDDDDDVAWALQTAQVQWKRGSYADAVVWLRRAVESAVDAGAVHRAAEIGAIASRLTERMLAQVQGTPPSSRSGETRAGEVDDLLDDGPSRLPLPSFPIDVEVDFGRGGTDADTERQFRQARTVTPAPAAPRPSRGGTSLDQTRSDEQPLRPAPPPRVPAPATRARFHSAPSFVTSAPPLDTPLPSSRSKYASHGGFGRRDAEPDSEPTIAVANRLLEPITLAAPPPEEGDESSLAVALAREELDRHALTEHESTEHEVSSESEQPDSSASGVHEAAEPDARLTAADELAQEPSLHPLHPATSETPFEDETLNAESLMADTLGSGSLLSERGDLEMLPSQPPPSIIPLSQAPPSPGEASIGGIALAGVAGLQDLPEEAQHELVAKARLQTLAVEEEVSFSVALVVEGWVTIMPTIADAACAHAPKGAVVFTAGTLSDAFTLRVVAGQAGTVVAVWEGEALENATADCPWVADELRVVADRFQALAGVTMGAMGDRLDDSLRAMVTDRCEVKTLLPFEVLVEKGNSVPGLHVVGGGRIEIIVESDEGTGEVAAELGPGDFLFAPQVLAAGPAPATARAGKGGALILFANRMTAHELLVSVPPLLEILAD